MELLVWRDYEREEQELFLDMMRSCGVCFVHREGGKDREAEYIAPDLLPQKSEVQDQLDALWDIGGEICEKVYEHDLLHPGLIRAIIAEIGDVAGVSALYWRTGVCVYEKSTHAHALIEEIMIEGWSGRVVVQTRGGQAQELLARLCERVEELQGRLGLKPREDESDARGKQHRRDLSREPGRGGAPNEKPLDFGAEPRPPSVYVSYAWGDPGDRDREKIVDQLCEEAEKRGKPIIRDKTTLHRGDRISKFMKQIAQGDRIYVILSDKYLKSPFCMFELCEIWRQSRHDEEHFLGRVRLFVLDDAKIWTPLDRVKCAKYWKDQHDGLNAAIEEAGAALLGESDFRKFRLMQDFAHHVGDILALFADTVQARTFEEFTGFDD